MEWDPSKIMVYASLLLNSGASREFLSSTPENRASFDAKGLRLAPQLGGHNRLGDAEIEAFLNWAFPFFSPLVYPVMRGRLAVAPVETFDYVFSNFDFPR